MATTEAVIPSAAQHAKDYDLFNLVQPQGEFVPCSDVPEPFRVRIVGLEGQPIRESGGMDLEVRVSLAAYGREIVTGVQTAPSTNGRIEEWVYFPMTYGELPVDTLVCCTVVAPGDVIVGGCTFHIFTSRGALKRGPRRYKLHPKQAADPFEDTSTLGHTETDAWQHLARDFRQNRMPTVPWLDALATTRIRKLEAEGPGAASQPVGTSTSANPSLATLGPEQSFAVIDGQTVKGSATDLSSSQVQRAPGEPARSNDDAAELFLSVELPTTSTGHPMYRTTYSSAFAEARRKAPNFWATDATPMAPFPDLAVGADNLCEQKAMLLARSTNLVHDPDAKPSANERRYLERIAQQPPIAAEGASFTAEQAGLLWRYRRYATGDPKLFRPFMASIDWANDKEAAEAAELIPRWKPVTLADALGLLATSIKPLRAHAVTLLAAESDATMVLLLLQLVQAMRFDTDGDELFLHLVQRATRSWRLCSFMFWYLSVEADLEERGALTLCKGTKEGLSSTRLGYCRLSGETYADRRLRMLAHMEKEAPEFHRRLVGQQELRAVLTSLYKPVREDATKDRVQKMAAIAQLVKEGKCGVAELFSNGQVVYLPSHPHLAVKGISGDGVYMFKSAKMPVKLDFILAHEADVVDEAVTARFPAEDTPAIAVDAVADAPTSARMSAGEGSLKSQALLRAGGRDRSSSTADGTLQAVPSSSLGRSGTFEEPQRPDSATLSLMFKCGDDVRQDQLVIQFIELMDALLKQNGLNLWLTPYRALATSQNDGFVELVPDCATFQDVQRGTVVKHLHKLHPTPAGYDRALDKFVKSTAGYCVITFLLGIGDRHLENLLIIKDGRLFHVDFGFFMGKDPKPFPPPMKLNKEMVDTMGGANGKQYRNFKTYCCSAFNILRAHAQLLLNLLLLMSDASIPNLDDDGKVDPRVNIARVQDKLRLDLNDAEAAQYFLGVINDSLGARFTNLWDKVHEVAQDVRH